MHGLYQIEQLFTYDALLQLAGELRQRQAGEPGPWLHAPQEYIPFSMYVLQLEPQGHPRFAGLAPGVGAGHWSLPQRARARQPLATGYVVSSEQGTFCLQRTTLALWVASLSLSQLKATYPRVLEGNNSATLVLTPPAEFGVLVQPGRAESQLYTNAAAFARELQPVAAETGVVLAHTEAADQVALYYQGRLVAQAPSLQTEHFVQLLTQHLHTAVAYQAVKPQVLAQRYNGRFPDKLDNFANWDGEVQEHQQFPLANLFYVRVQAGSEAAAVHMAREEIALQRKLHPVRVASRGVPFEIDAVLLLDQLPEAGFYEVRYRFLPSHHIELASAS